MSDQPRYRANDSNMDVGVVLGSLSAAAAPGPVFSRLLQGLGHSESGARNLLTKLVHAGALTSTRVGRVSVYAFADQNVRKYQQVEGTGSGPGWDGVFRALVYDIPEKQRGYRDRFRYLAAFNGYGVLRPGVLISPREHSPDLDALVAEAPGTARIHRVALTPDDAAQARVLAAEAWDLVALGTRYEAVLAEIRAAREEGVGEGVAEDPYPAFRRWARLYRHVFELETHNPDLPAELLPERWPKEGYWAALSELNAEWGPAIQPVLRRIVDEADPAGLTVYYPPPWAAGDAPGADPVSPRPARR